MTDEAATPDLRPFELLRDGWQFIQPHYPVWLGVCVLQAFLYGVFSRIPWIGGPALLLVIAAGNAGLCWYLLRAYQGRHPSYATLLEPMQQQPVPILVLHLVCGVAVGLGLVLLILPGILIGVALWMTLPLVLLERLPVAAAMSRSWQVVYPQLGDYCLLAVVLVLVNFIAALPMGLGLLFSVPATYGALTLVSARALKIGTLS